MSLYRKLKNGEIVDVMSMQYFIPSSCKVRIYPNDKIKMANLSSRGIVPKNETKGYKALKIGKTYRDEIIERYKEDIQNGFVTKGEIIDWLPKRLKDWMWNKIKNVPYDVDYKSSNMWIRMYHNGKN